MVLRDLYQNYKHTQKKALYSVGLVGNVFHIEEQRNMSEEDLCRFAVYHFSASRDWNYKIHDIILISGTSYICDHILFSTGLKKRLAMVVAMLEDRPIHVRKEKVALNLLTY
jgi:hypothetical protein